MSSQNEKNDRELPKYWVQRVSKSRNGKIYYFNTKTRESVWKLSDLFETKPGATEVVGESPKKQLTKVKSPQKLPQTSGTPKLKPPQNLAENRLKNLLNSLNGTGSASGTGTPGKKVVSPDKKLRKIQSATSFKRNIAQSRLKTLQTNLKQEQIRKELVKLEGATDKKVKVDGPSQETNVNNNNNNVIVKEVPTKPEKKEDPSALVQTRSPTIGNDIQSQYEQFVAQFKKTDVEVNGTISEDSLMSEPMDWEYTSDDILSTSEATNTSVNKEVTVPLETFETMEQYLNYKNLLNDELEFDQKYFHVVVDTNVFLSNLSFIEKLIKINFKNYGSPIIVVPYIVLQELDNIKSRFESKFVSLSTKAKAAIHFLNEKLKDHHKQFCGQSAKEDATKLISITSQDDDIVNCLLQIKEKVKDTVILLSNDKNLRNKAIVSGITSYSTSELESSQDSLKIFTPNS